MKLKEFQSYLKERKIYCALIFNTSTKRDPAFTYFTGLTDINGALIVKKDLAFVIVSPLEFETAKNNSSIKKVYKIKKGFIDDIKSKVKHKKIGINYDYVSIKLLKNLRNNLKSSFTDVSEKISELRCTKTGEEIKRIKKAASIASSIIRKAIAKASSRMTEIQLRDFIESEMKKMKARPSFPTIVAASKNASCPHHIPASKKLSGFVVIDMGVVYKNYCSDITRTIYIGKPSEKELNDYDLVLQVNKECISKAEENAKASEIHMHAAGKLGRDFIHSLGHGIGIEVHENPRIARKSGEKLKKGMVFTIEPALYRKNYGIRIEDDILLGDTPISLTQAQKSLVIKH
ncbi:MAG: Xaa-Pro peptidase family protein [Nanoarchaeota archaeon]